MRVPRVPRPRVRPSDRAPSVRHRPPWGRPPSPVRPGDQRGAAAVEFALLMPLLLLVVFGSIQYGLYFWAMQGGSDITRDAARLSAVGAAADCASFRQAVTDQVESLNGYGESVSVRRTYVDAPPNGINVGDTVEVELVFRSVDLGLPFLPFVEDGTVRSRVAARVEFVPTPPEACVP